MAATAQEQLILEYINDARLDPLGDAARYIASYSPLKSNDPQIDAAIGPNGFKVDGDMLHQQFAALKSVQPVAWNDELGAAALGHTRLMIKDDQQSHQLPGEEPLQDRISDQGYDWTNIGENIFAYADSPLYAHASFMIDWGGDASTGGMQSPPGHRDNIMDADFREVGVGTAAAHPASFNDVGPLVVTEDFGSRGTSGAIVLGVDYTDKDHDGFYSVGEGVGGLKVTVGTDHAASAAAGGYSLDTALTGRQTVGLSGGGLAGTAHATLTLRDGLNVKLDVIDGHILHSSASVTAWGGGIDTVVGLGIHGLVLTTGAGNQTIDGTKGADRLSGGAGNDVLVGGAGADRVDGGLGNDHLYGNSGRDTFVFDTALGKTNVDVIGGFTHGQDRMELDHAVFAALGAPGALTPGFFDTGGVARQADDHIIYNPNTGALYYDADGKGGAAEIHFATLAHNLPLTSADFLVG